MLLSAFPAMTWQRNGKETVLTGVLDRLACTESWFEIESLGLELLEVRQITDREGDVT